MKDFATVRGEVLRSTTPPWRPIFSRQLSLLLGVSLQSLANWRVRGTGPDFRAAEKGQGNKMFYRPVDVVAWLSALNGEPLEAWQLCRDWLAERGVRVDGGGRESTEWLIQQVDQFFT